MASFKNFSWSLIFCNLKMIHSYVIFCHLSCLAFPELPGYVVWCLALIWGKFSAIIVSNISFPFSFFSSFWHSHYVYVKPLSDCPTILGYSVLFYFFPVFLKISICLFILSICSYMLSTFSIETLTILIKKKILGLIPTSLPYLCLVLMFVQSFQNVLLTF